ncbi:hypothetical protein AU476_06155 [Cupriavidus sp. UYMSc13B]|nr:hypothetical protein AU476_06155 [Cupriavidus sp. UYMSc13B]
MSKNNSLVIAGLASMILMSGPALAQSEAVSAAAKPASRTAAQQLADLQVENMILEMKAKNAKLAAEIRTAEQGPSATAATASPMVPSLQMPLQPAVGMAGNASSLAPAAAVRSNDGPTLISITAYDGRFRANIDIDGRIVQRSQGESIDGGWSVSRISESSVELKRNKQLRVLRM